MNRWEDLDPDPRLLAALDQADRERGQRAQLIVDGSASDKNNWSNSFADACARMIATALRERHYKKRLSVLPDPEGSAEPPTITYWDRGEAKTKKIDVLVGDLIGGLQVAVSLKGVGFRDKHSLGFGKNITGRLYELENETRRLHEYRPQAVVVGLYFVPIGAVQDKKTTRSASGFADVVTSLRRLTGRADAHRQDEWHRVDLGFVGLYVPGDSEHFVVRNSEPMEYNAISYKDPFPRGVVRYFDVREDPPVRGRPQIDRTLALEEMIDVIANVQAGPREEQLTWSPAELDPPVRGAQ
ncbi:MAG: hypothetical protein ACLP41_00570 [Acidimicrobiales bacterium]|jgi:hypothetical protein